MSEPEIVLSAKNLGKRYVLGGLGFGELNKSFREMLIDLLAAPFKRYKKLSGKVSESELFWALKDVNFDIKKGEIVGVIGKNGAGKSTLLKILSRITTPTKGSVTIRGNVASLLEVGTGFHPELTGRENIFLNGAILGMKRDEITEKFADIVKFANVEKFVDTPVKRYSSGMYVRLAFSIAAHLEPDILIVDEVLAVGDMHFQKKCLGKLEDISSTGRTVIFVSHNMASVQKLCNRGILLDGGNVVFDGAVEATIKQYLTVGENRGTNGIYNCEDSRASNITSKNILLRVILYGRESEPTNSFTSGSKLRIVIEVDAQEPIDNPHFSIGFNDTFGVRLFTLSTYFSDYSRSQIEGKYTIQCDVDELNLASGSYNLSVSVGNARAMVLDLFDRGLNITVNDVGFFNNGRGYIKGCGAVLKRSGWQELSVDSGHAI